MAVAGAYLTNQVQYALEMGSIHESAVAFSSVVAAGATFVLPLVYYNTATTFLEIACDPESGGLYTNDICRVSK